MRVSYFFSVILAILVSCKGGGVEVGGNNVATKAASVVNPSKQKWTISCNVKDLPDGVIMIGDTPFGAQCDTVTVKDGKFVISGGEISQPIHKYIYRTENKALLPLYVGGGETTVTANFVRNGCVMGKKMKFADVKIDGHIANAQANELQQKIEKLRVEMGKKRRPINEFNAKVYEFKREFVKSNPNAFYSGEIIYLMGENLGKDSLRNLLNLVNPDLISDHLTIVRERAQ